MSPEKDFVKENQINYMNSILNNNLGLELSQEVKAHILELFSKRTDLILPNLNASKEYLPNCHFN